MRRRPLAALPALVAPLLLAGAVPAAPQQAGAGTAPVESELAALDREATSAYRAGDHATAAELWADALPLAPPGPERARLLYNLGNAAYRRGERLEAVGWYHAALRHAPRDPDLWANLELARAEAQLEPADRGDLKSTVERLLSAPTRAEAQWLVLLALLPLAVCLGGEALRGGRTWRRLALLALGLVLVAAAPLAWQAAHDGGHPMLVVADGGAAARSEPNPDAARLARLDAGSLVERRDALPGWIKVAQDGRELWVREQTVFDLLR